MDDFDYNKPINDKNKENPNKKWVLDFIQWKLKLREQNYADNELFISETWLCFTKDLEKQVSSMIAGEFTFNWELWRILKSLKDAWDDRISEQSKIFGPLMRIWRLELEFKVMKDIIRKEEMEQNENR